MIKNTLPMYFEQIAKDANWRLFYIRNKDKIKSFLTML